MASNSEKVDQDATPPRFNLGDLVKTNLRGIWSLAVICPDIGSNDQYTKVKKSDRYYHVQRLGHYFELHWLPECRLNIIKHDDVQAIACSWSIDDCKMFMEKSNEERVVICSMRAKANKNQWAHIRDYGELFESKVHNELLKNELQMLKESIKDTQSLKNDLKNINESQNDIKKSLEEFKDVVKSQNQDKTQIEQEIGSNSNSANAGNDEQKPFCFEQPLKKMKMEGESEEIQKLNQIIKNLKKDNLKLSKRNEEMQTQNETMIKNLKEDCLKLARENVELKYGNGSNVQQGHQVPQMPQGPPQGVQTSYRMQHQRPVMMQQVQIVRSANGQPLRNVRPGQQIRFATKDHPGPWGPYGRGPTF